MNKFIIIYYIVVASGIAMYSCGNGDKEVKKSEDVKATLVDLSAGMTRDSMMRLLGVPTYILRNPGDTIYGYPMYHYGTALKVGVRVHVCNGKVTSFDAY